MSAHAPRDHHSPVLSLAPEYFPRPPQRFRDLCSRQRLLALFGDSVVRLSTANTYSYQKGELPHPATQPAGQHPEGSTNQS